MAFASWSEDLSVNVPSLDAQHKEFINLINTLHNAIQAGRGRESVQYTFDQLLLYAVTHFQQEEKYMRETNCPSYAQHKSEHEQFLREVRGMYERFQTGGSHLMVETISYLSSWLTSHIAKEDKKYAPAKSAAAAR